MTGPEHYREAEDLLDDAFASKDTTFEGNNPEADRMIAAAQVHATLAQIAPAEEPDELTALRQAVAALLHDAETSADGQLPDVMTRFRWGLPDTVHGDRVLALSDELMRAEGGAVDA